MGRFLTLILALLWSASVFAQLQDDFSDGNITSNPVWNGNTDHFSVVNGELQLTAPAAGTSLLYTGITLGETAEWQFLFRMTFAPSASNQLRVYLMLDQPDIGTANGYYLEVGENGSADALRFFRLDGGASSLIATGTADFGSDPTLARVRVTRDQDALWVVEADLTGGMDFQPQCTVTDVAYDLSGAELFALRCSYTETRKDRFFFDDIYAGGFQQDNVPPAVTSLSVIDNQHLRLQYSEEVPDGALIATHYEIAGLGTASDVVFDGAAHTAITITSPQTFTSGTQYNLNISNIPDLAGNTLDTTLAFSYIVLASPEPYDILINEIMADPTPVVGLPDAEYLELYNRSNSAFDLNNYALTVGTQTVLLPTYQLPADSYVVLIDDGNAGAYPQLSNKLIFNMPALTNSGTTIELDDDLGNPLHQISYDLNSYQDPARDDGGWSLELINPMMPCAIAGNLRASNDLKGGTPGQVNSVSANPTPDTEGPVLVRVTPMPGGIQLIFDEILNDIGYAVSILPDIPIGGSSVDRNTLFVLLQSPPEPGVQYTISVGAIEDCLGTQRTGQSIVFGIAEEAEEGDLILNEILYNPTTGGDRFIEVYNTSQKFIDLGNVVVADIQGDTLSAYPVASSFLLGPGGYAALTPDVADISTRYFMHDPNQFVETPLPAFDRSAGNVTIYTRNGVVLDVFDYSDDLHNALLDNTRGVSLERLSASAPTQDASNWYSAAQSAGFATPGLPNSQLLQPGQGDGDLVLEPETFSPDGDGFDDLLSIRLNNPPTGALARIRVYDTQGREVARVAENVSVGNTATFRWDGVTASGDRARIGPHIIWVELVAPDGSVKHYKETCVVAARL